MAPLATTSQPAIPFVAEQCLSRKSSFSSPVAGSKKVSKPSVHVAFDERVRVRNVLHVFEYTDEELVACWFTDEEFASMKETVGATASQIEEGLLESDNSQYCRRGAESQAQPEARRRRKARNAAIDAVLNEQCLQWQEGSCDPDFIASLYATKCAHSREAARKMALQDELEAAL